jgi:hypothetical protein
MLGRLTHLLIALAVVWAAAVPVLARTASIPAGMTGMPVQQHCPNCPQHSGNDSNPDMMSACQVLVCAAAVAVLPASTQLPGRILSQATYLMGPPVRWTEAPPAPDPFPPRPIALV